jgi:hypothetical protein
VPTYGRRRPTLKPLDILSGVSKGRNPRLRITVRESVNDPALRRMPENCAASLDSRAENPSKSIIPANAAIQGRVPQLSSTGLGAAMTVAWGMDLTSRGQGKEPGMHRFAVPLRGAGFGEPAVKNGRRRSLTGN